MSVLLRNGTNAAALARARATLHQREREFRAFEAHALRRHAEGDPAAAAAWAQIACNIGWARPSSILTAPALEAMLHDIGRQHVTGGGHVGDDDPRRVLHVLTESYSTGGHTRVVERWVERDDREASVLLTDQRSPIPEEMKAKLAAQGARLLTQLPGEDALARAKALRAIAVEHDLVVLHVHMHDVLPALAFADPVGRPPVVFFEHASHQFWIGSAAVDVLACIRDLEVEHASDLRGFPAERVRRLPLPRVQRSLPSRAEARRQIGLADDVPLILTVASPWKVQPALEPTFPQLCSEVLDASPSAEWIVVGPPSTDTWEDTLRRHGHRLHMPGGIADIGPVLAAADVYFDSWPVSGATTILDVAAAGLPIVSLTDDSRDMGMVRAVATLGDGAISASSPSRAAQAVAELLADPERRSTMAGALREAIAHDHDDGWGSHLETLVAAAREHRGNARAIASPPTSPPDWQCLLELLASAAAMPSPYDVAHVHVALIPPAERPVDVPSLVSKVDAILSLPDGESGDAAAAVLPRAVAQPRVERDAIAATVERFREVVAAGAVHACVAVLHPDEVETGITLLQAALDAGPDVDIDIVVAPSIDAVAARDDIVIASL